MTDSPFSTAGPRLRENDIAILPLMAGEKVPGVYTQKSWRPENKWQRFCTRLPSKYEMDIWGGWPDAGICVALGPASAPAGFQLVALDIDTEDPEVAAAIAATVPPSPVRKKGRKGETGFYLASLNVSSRPYNDAAKRRMLDLLCEGRETVLPPSIHPDTGQPYVWISLDTLESFSVADLPVLPDDIAERLGAALAPWGYVPPALGSTTGDATLDAESPHRTLNDAALANLDSWVPAMQLHGCVRNGAHYRAIAHWRPSSSGRPTAKRSANLSIEQNGIRDFGDDRAYTALDLVMAAFGVDLDTAFRWLQERVAPLKPVFLAVTQPRDNPAPAATPPPAQEPAHDTTNLVELRPGNLAGLITPCAPYIPKDPPTAVIPPELCRPAGLLGEVVDWFHDTASTPIPQHNLGMAICFLGTLMGRRFETPTRARTNFYMMALADSGAGKDHPMDAARHLAFHTATEKFMGAEETKSDSAIRKLLEKYPVALLTMDEFGGFLKKVLDRRAAAHDRRMRDLMLTFFSRANGDYMGAEGASERAVMIRSPNLSIYGASTPADMWKAFDSASGEDGLLARFLLFQASDSRPHWEDPKMDVTQCPHALRQHIGELLSIRPGGNLMGVGAGPVKPIRASWGPEAGDWWIAYKEANRALSAAGGARATIYSRAAEHVVKLALVQAVGCDPQRPVITVSALEWAQTVVECSMAAMFKAIEDRVADGEKHAEYLWVKRMIREAGAHGIPIVELKKRVNGRFDKRRTDDIIAQLTEASEIETCVGSGNRGGRPTGRFRAVVADEDAA